jgi:hypothetical protein
MTYNMLDYLNKNHEKIYEEISTLLDIKFKVQLKNCEIEFTKICKIIDLISHGEYYSLVIDNRCVINFNNKNQFINKFVKLIKEKLNELEIENIELTRNQLSENSYDRIESFYNSERFGHLEYKLNKLIEKLEKNIKK